MAGKDFSYIKLLVFEVRQFLKSENFCSGVIIIRLSRAAVVPNKVEVGLLDINKKIFNQVFTMILGMTQNIWNIFHLKQSAIVHCATRRKNKLFRTGARDRDECWKHLTRVSNSFTAVLHTVGKKILFCQNNHYLLEKRCCFIY